MNVYGNDCFSLRSLKYSEDDILIKKLLLTHDPDGRRLDSELLLRAMENVMSYASLSEVCGFHIKGIAKNDISDIEVAGSQETLGYIICKISNEMLYKCTDTRDLHARTMVLFDLLGKYGWDAKVALILAAFATRYGEFWLIMQLHHDNPLAMSVAMLKQLPRNLIISGPRFKALSLLVKTMVDVTKCIIKFEGIPFRYVTLDDESMVATRSCIYIAAYWVTRSTLACSSQIKDLTAMKPEQVFSNSTIIAAWELSSLAHRLSNVYSRLKLLVDLCLQQIETKMQPKLLNLFQDAHTDNQEVLDVLLALKYDLPLKKASTQAKIGVSELKDKVVILLVSKPELLPLEGLLQLVHQTYDHPHHKNLDGSYEIVWIPISSSDSWTDAEEEIFNFLSDSLPWYSVRRPWVLNSGVVKYIKQEWGYEDDPLMVVLDSKGLISNSNAIDMVLIWGARAYPFSFSREKELWQEENWTLQLLVDEIDYLLTTWVNEGREICIYGSDNIDWTAEFSNKVKKIRSEGVQVEMVYAGNKNLGENERQILAVINEEMHSKVLSFTKLRFFWRRLESMGRSKLRLGQAIDSDHVLEQVSALLGADHNSGWAVIGRGSGRDVVKLEGSKAMEWLDKFAEWGENVARLGFLGALRNALEPPLIAGPCNHTKIIPYPEGPIEGHVATCDKCRRVMKEYVVYE